MCAGEGEAVPKILTTKVVMARFGNFRVGMLEVGNKLVSLETIRHEMGIVWIVYFVMVM